MSIHDHEHFIIHHRTLKRLKELGLEDQLPSIGITRIIVDETTNYWAEVGGYEEGGEVDPAELNILEEVAVGAPVKGYDIVGIGPDGLRANIAFKPQGEAAIYSNGHRLVMGASQKIISYHQDGSECIVQCRGCEEPDVRFFEEGNEVYIKCGNCSTETDLYADVWVALGAWLIGKVEKPE